MKHFLFGVAAVVILLAAGCAAPDVAPSANVPPASTPSASTPETLEAPQTDEAATGQMTVTSSGVADGIIDPAYGANGDVKENGIPILSLPLEIAGAPEGTACFAVYMDDPDARPLCGYSWVHWMAVNIGESSIPEDFSHTAHDKAVQGTNDNGTIGYAGPAPPDKDHTYVITVYALDAGLTLSEGFSKAEFAEAIEGHVLASATLEGIYRK